MKQGHEFTPDWFSMPGDSLRALMLRRGLAAKDVADHLHGGMATLRSLLDGTGSVDERQAAALAEHLGGTVSFWLKRQKNYEVALERAVDLAVASEGDDWLLLPVPGERPRGRLSAEKRRAEVQRRLKFFNVGTLKAWQARYGRICSDTLFRKSAAFTSDDAAILMWLRMGELSADLVDTRSWSAGNLQDRLDEIRKLSKVKHPNLFLPKLRELCSEAGVAVVAKRAPLGCPASGASRMIGPDKAMILLSFRGLSDDKFWFTVFHEIGHLLLHGACAFVDADMDDGDEVEREANQFASRCIVPNNNVDEFEQLEPAREKVVRFSVRVGVAPGLTVGQMQHRGMIRQDQLNYLKRRWKWEQVDHLLD
ncbi:ImmA/IrrE family metallo-endopeptidase [Methylobacterium sp. Leaf123]|uniref:ImmA/IrrE family metallo-endopeptidase n=1 Tax=Methylobacterium sp. Leaf123 TaxID=1736264 RepID=UPI000A4D9D98|nr:ImmA/IrrE family metallo-endopeptidase [Methylobacterium sp. Leaf123]